MWTLGNCEGTPNDHRSSRGDDHRRASPSFCWRCGWRPRTFPKVLCGHLETARGRPMTTEAHEVTTADELRHPFVGGVGGGHVSPRCFVDTWNCEGTPDDHRNSRGDDRRRASPSFCWRCGWRTCFRVMWTLGNCEGTPDDHRSSRGDDHRRASPIFLLEVWVEDMFPCYVDTWKLRGDAR